MRGHARRCTAVLLVAVGVVVANVLSAGLSSAPTEAAGILPPANPSANIPPDSTDWLTAIDHARAHEGLGPLGVSEAALATLPLPQQVLTVVNEERTDRGLPPIDEVTSQLDGYALAGANAGDDPTFPPVLTGGIPLTFGGSVWAGGLTSVLEADYYWMYDDGWSGGSTTNTTCTVSSPSGCWGHRDIILENFPDCGHGPPVLSMGAAFSATGFSGGSLAALMVSSCIAPSDVVATWGQVAEGVVAGAQVVGMASTADGRGYWEVAADGRVAALGAAQDFGSPSGALNSPIVGMAATPDGRGYWLVASDGGVFSFGDAAFFGSTGSLRLNSPIVGMAITPDGRGYWLVASDGGVFTFGDAAFDGSMGGTLLNRPVVGMSADRVTGGYWLVAADGGVFSFGAPFFGSTGGTPLNEPIVGMESQPGGNGYRFVAADGGIFTFGHASFEGSTGGLKLAAPVVGMAADDATGGYRMAAADGGIFTFGGASYLGRMVAGSL